MTSAWKRRLLYFAGAWTLIGGASALFDPAAHLSQFYTAEVSLEGPVELFFFRCVWIQVMAWGLGYIFAARHPAAMQPILTAGAIGKTLYFVACLALFRSGAATALLLAGGVVDLVFAAFFVSLVWGKPTSSPWPQVAA